MASVVQSCLLQPQLVSGTPPNSTYTFQIFNGYLPSLKRERGEGCAVTQASGVASDTSRFVIGHTGAIAGEGALPRACNVVWVEDVDIFS